MSAKLLAGYKVLDFTQVVAGPTATRLMAEMGAEVIKVEQAPAGDPVRVNPTVRNGRSAYFVQHNIGKQSLCVNLKTDAGRALVRKLVPSMDVVIESYSPGVMERMGLGYAALKQINPRLVMCSISALGQSGPLAQIPGYDYIAQAYAGVTEVIGERDQTPVIPLAPLGDVSTGVHALAAVACALLYRERTGEGQYIDVSLLDAYIHTHDFAVQRYSTSGGKFVTTRNGAHHLTIVPCGVFRARQGYIVIIATLDHQWKSLIQAMGRPELAEDARFRGYRERLHNRAILIDEIERWLQSFPDRDSAVAALDQARVPAAPVLTIPEVVQHPHLLEREAIRSITDPVLGEFQVPGFPFRFSTDAQSDTALVAPDLGEHNHAVLTRYLGYDAQEVARLTDEGVLVEKRSGG